MVLYPNPSREEPFALFVSGLHVYHGAAHFSKKILAHEFEVVMFLLKILVEHNHLGKAHWQELAGEYSLKRVKEVAPEAGMLFLEKYISGAVAHVEPPEKVLIAYWSNVVILIFMQILDVGLGQRMHALHGRDEGALARYDPVDRLVE